jgi:hypothetical protein
MDKDLAIAGVIITLSLGFFFMNIIPNWFSIIGTIVAGVFLMYSPFTQAERLQKNMSQNSPVGITVELKLRPGHNHK